MSDYRITKRKQEHVLVAQADLSIQNADKFHQALIRLFKKETPVAIDLTKIERIDLAGYQLLLSAHSSMKKQKLRILGNSEIVKNLIQSSGFVQDSILFNES